MRFSLGAFLLTIFLAGCHASSQSWLVQELNKGTVNLRSAPPGANYQYELTFPNLIDFGFNLDRREDRQIVVNNALSQCESPTIVSEDRVVVGAPLGREIANWTVRVAC